MMPISVMATQWRARTRGIAPMRGARTGGAEIVEGTESPPVLAAMPLSSPTGAPFLAVR